MCPHDLLDPDRLPDGVRGWAVADPGGWTEVIRVGAVELRTRWREDRLIGRCDHAHFLPDPAELGPGPADTTARLVASAAAIRAWRRLRIDAEAEARRHRFARLTALEPHAATGAPATPAARADAIRALFDHWAGSRQEKLELLSSVGVDALPPALPDRAPAIRPAGEVAPVHAEIAARVGRVAPAIVAMCHVPAAEDWQIWLTVAEVAEMMKVAPEDVESWIDSGLLGKLDLPARDGTPTPRILPRHIERFRSALEARSWPEAPAPQGAAVAAEAPAGSAAGSSRDSAGPPPKLRPPRRGRHGRPAR